MDRNNFNRKIKLKKRFKRYKTAGGKKNLLTVVLRYVAVFLIFAFISYVMTLLIYSFINREHCTKVEIPEDYGQQEDEKKTTTDKLKQEEGKDFNFNINAIEMPRSLIFNEASIDEFLKKAKNSGKNSVIIILKDEEGNVLYDSDVKFAREWNTVVKNPVDAALIAEKIKKQGLVPIAKINAFLDQKATAAFKDNSFVLKHNEDALFKFEDFATKKVRAWLNPCSRLTKKYILGLAKEIKNLGYKNILFENMQFPYCEFSDRMKNFEYFDNIDKNEVLIEYFKRLKELDANILFAFDYDAFETFDEENGKAGVCFGGNLLKFKPNVFVPILKNGSDKEEFIETISNFKKKNNFKFVPKIEIKENNNIIKKLKEEYIDESMSL